MSEFPYEVENYVPEDDPNFEVPPSDAATDTPEGTDKDAPVITDDD